MFFCKDNKLYNRKQISITPLVRAQTPCPQGQHVINRKIYLTVKTHPQPPRPQGRHNNK